MLGFRFFYFLLAVFFFSTIAHAYETRNINLTACPSGGACTLASGITAQGIVSVDQEGVRLGGTKQVDFRGNDDVFWQYYGTYEKWDYEDIEAATDDEPFADDPSVYWILEDNSYYMHDYYVYDPVRVAVNNGYLYVSKKKYFGKFSINTNGSLTQLWAFTMSATVASEALFKNNRIYLPIGNTVRIYEETTATTITEVKRVTLPNTTAINKILFYKDYLVILAGNTIYMHPAAEYETIQTTMETGAVTGGVTLDERINVPTTEPVRDIYFDGQHLYIACNTLFYIVRNIDTYGISYTDPDSYLYAFSYLFSSSGGFVEPVTSDEGTCTEYDGWGDCISWYYSLYMNRIRKIMAETKGGVEYIYIADEEGFKVVTEVGGNYEQVAYVDGFGYSEGLYKHGSRIYLNDYFTTSEIDITDPEMPFRANLIANGSNGSFTEYENRLFMGGWGRVKWYSLYDTTQTEAYLYLPDQEYDEPVSYVRFVMPTDFPQTAKLEVRPDGATAWQVVDNTQGIELAEETDIVEARIKYVRATDMSPEASSLKIEAGNSAESAYQKGIVGEKVVEDTDLKKYVEAETFRRTLGSMNIARTDIMHEEKAGLPIFKPTWVYEPLLNKWLFQIPMATLLDTYQIPTLPVTVGWKGEEIYLHLPNGIEKYVNTTKIECTRHSILPELAGIHNYIFLPEPGQGINARLEVQINGGDIPTNAFSDISIKAVRVGADGSKFEFSFAGPRDRVALLPSDFYFGDGNLWRFAFTAEPDPMEEQDWKITNMSVFDTDGRYIKIDAIAGSIFNWKGLWKNVGGSNSTPLQEQIIEIHKGSSYTTDMYSRQTIDAPEYARYERTGTSGSWTFKAEVIGSSNIFPRIVRRTDTYASALTGDTIFSGDITLTTSAESQANTVYTLSAGRIDQITVNLANGDEHKTELDLMEMLPEEQTTAEVCKRRFYYDAVYTTLKHYLPPVCSFYNSRDTVAYERIITETETKEGESAVVKRVTKERYNPWRKLIKRELLNPAGCSPNVYVPEENCLAEQFRYDEEGNLVRHILPDGRAIFNFYERNNMKWGSYMSYYSQNPLVHLKSGNLLYSTEVLAGEVANYTTNCDEKRFVGPGNSAIPSSCFTNTANKWRVKKMIYTAKNDVREVTDYDGRRTNYTYDYDENGLIKFLFVPTPIYFFVPPITPIPYVLTSTSTSLVAPDKYSLLKRLATPPTATDWNGDGITTQQKRRPIVEKHFDSASVEKERLYFAYNDMGLLTKQGMLKNSAINYVKGFEFLPNTHLVKQDFLLNGSTPWYPNFYAYDEFGRKIAEKNSANVETFYAYDPFDRVVRSNFGCDPDISDLDYSDFNEDPDPTLSCEYKRDYAYDGFNNPMDMTFEEKYSVVEYPSTNTGPIVVPSSMHIYQKTFYDILGRAYLSCQGATEVSSYPAVAKTQAGNRCIETKHDMFGNIVYKEENGVVREVTYDHLSNPVSVIENGVLLEESTYENGRLASLTNKYDKTATTAYDAWGRKSTVTDPFGQVLETIYDDAKFSDRVVSELTKAQQEGSTSLYLTGESGTIYDNLGKVWKKTSRNFVPGETALPNFLIGTTNVYDDMGNIIETYDSLGSRTKTYYDALNRVKMAETYVNSELMTTTETCYYGYNDSDMQGDCSAFSSPATGRVGATITTSGGKTVWNVVDWYDALGRPLRTCKSLHDGNMANFRCAYTFYNTGGQVIWTADEEAAVERDVPGGDFQDLIGNEKFFKYNAFGQVIKSIYKMTDDGLGGNVLDPNSYLNDGLVITTTEYDDKGRIIARENDRDGRVDYLYYSSGYGNGQLWSETISPAPAENDATFEVPLQKMYTYGYDTYGDLETTAYNEDWTDNNKDYSLAVTYERDEFGRIVSKSTDGAEPVTQIFTYDKRNLLKTAEDGDVTVTRQYNSSGSVWKEIVAVGGTSKTVETYASVIAQTAIDLLQNNVKYPDGNVLQKTFVGGYLASVKYNSSDVGTYDYTEGMIDTITKGNGLEETYTYTPWRKLDTLTESVGSTPVKSYDYGYTRAWHLNEKTDTLDSRTEAYTYDSYYRLREVDYNNDGVPDENYTLDGVHNIELSTEDGVSFAWGVDKYNRLRNKIGGGVTNTYSYDARDNMTAETDGTDTTEYVYDDLNRLIGVKVNGIPLSAYLYDAFNRRIMKQSGTSDHWYAYDDWNIIAEYVTEGTTTYTNYIDTGMDGHLAMVPGGNIANIKYFSTDERGNVVALVNASGTILERYRYTAYGQPTIMNADFSPRSATEAVSPFLWGGSYMDNETGLYWMRNRYYHIDMKRFINQDPIGIWGDANNLGNGFAYVAGMVIEHSDPTGLEITSKSALGQEIIARGKTESTTFNALASSSNDIFKIQNDQKTKSNLGAYNDPSNGVVVLSPKLATKGLNAETGDGRYRDIGSDTCYLSPEAILAHEMREAEFQREHMYDPQYQGTKGKKKLLEDAHAEGIKAEQSVKSEQEEYKKKEEERKKKEQEDAAKKAAEDEEARKKKEEEEATKKKGNKGKYPGDPDNPEDASQTYFSQKGVSKVMGPRLHHKPRHRWEDQPEDWEKSPITKYKDADGKTQYIRNIFYREPDLLFLIFIDWEDADGKKHRILNPFRAPQEYGEGTTYERLRQNHKWFFQPEVDPW